MSTEPQWLMFERIAAQSASGPALTLSESGFDPARDAGDPVFIRTDLALRTAEHRDGTDRLARLKFSFPDPESAPEDDGDDLASDPSARSAELELALDDALAEQADVICAGERTFSTGAEVYLYFPSEMPEGELRELLSPVMRTTSGAVCTLELTDDPMWAVYERELLPTDEEEVTARIVQCFMPLVALAEELEERRELVLFFRFRDEASREIAARNAIKSGRRTEQEVAPDGAPLLGYKLISDVQLETVRARVLELTDLLKPAGGRFELFDTEIFNDPEAQDEDEDAADSQDDAPGASGRS